MAKTKLAAPLSGLRGTIGGLTYSENSSGTFVKPWAPPSNPKTTPQTTQQSHLARMPGLWAALTPTQRADWNTFAALPAQQLFDSLGQSYYASGWNWFVKCNIRLIRCTRATISNVPTIPRPAAPTIDGLRVTIAGTDTDLCSAGTPTASSSQGGYGPERAFDNILANAWLSDYTGPPFWIEYQLAATHIIRRYNLYVEDRTRGNTPEDWQFQGYNGATWDVLHSVTTWAPTADGWHSFYFPNETTYTRYRLNITAALNPALTYVRIDELEYLAGLVDGSVIMYPEDEFHTVAYDIVAHISMTLSPAKAVQYPGYYQIIANQYPGRWHQVIQDDLPEPFGTLLQGRRWFAHIYRQTSEGIRSAAAAIATNTETP